VSDGVVWAARWEPRGGGAKAELVRIDAATLRPIGRRVPIPKARLIGPDAVDVEAAGGVAWVTNGGYGTVMRYDSATDAATTVKVAGSLVDGALRDGTLWVPDAAGGALVPLDARTLGLPKAVLHTDYPLSVANGADALWVEAERTNTGPGGPTRLYRVDPRRHTLVGRPVEMGSDLGWIVAGLGAVWVRSGPKQALLKLVPTSPVPAPRPVARTEGPPTPLAAGPLRRGDWVAQSFAVPFTFSVASPGWIAIQNRDDAVELARADSPGAQVLVAAPAQAFAPSGRVTAVRTPRQTLGLIASNPHLAVGPRRQTTFGGLQATTVTLRVRPTRRYPAFCSAPCVALFGFPGYTVGPEGAGVSRLWVLRHAGRVVVALAGPDAQTTNPEVLTELVDTLRFR
jgi:hypothetical protein